jgi:hypothetical protein
MVNRCLCITLLSGRVEIMTMLLDAGADINAVDKDRSYQCVSYRNFRIISSMRSNCLSSVVQISASSIPLAAHCSRMSYNVTDDKRFAILLLDAGAPLDGLPKAG